MTRSLSVPQGTLPTPAEIVRYLDRFVHGQTEAKRAIATAVYFHYLGGRYRDCPEKECEDFGRQHILLFGPTGTGKTFIVKTLAKFLGVPVGFTSATSLVETGYVGEHVEAVVKNLLVAADHDVGRAEQGIIFIDEIDKIRVSQGSTRDVSGEGVQNGLLTLLDGRLATARGSDSAVDTSRILFVGTGAFVGIEEIVRKRLGVNQRVGFGGGDGSPGRTPSHAEILDRVEDEDLIEFGFIPELVGRFGATRALHPLERRDLVRVMTDAEGSSLSQHRAAFRLHDVELQFTDQALLALADRAVKKGTGARAIQKVVRQTLENVESRLPELYEEGVRGVTFTKGSIVAGRPPRYERVHESKIGALQQSLATKLRKRALPAGGAAGETKRGRSPGKRIRDDIEKLKERLEYSSGDEECQEWWQAFEHEYRHRLRIVLRLCEELTERKATITEFFECFKESKSDNIQANLHFLDYDRLRRAEKAKKSFQDKERKRRRKSREEDDDQPSLF